MTVKTSRQLNTSAFSPARLARPIPKGVDRLDYPKVDDVRIPFVIENDHHALIWRKRCELRVAYGVFLTAGRSKDEWLKGLAPKGFVDL